MSDELLQTKLFIPLIRPNLVPRPHLVEQLKRKLDLGSKVTLLSAPAGFGKTTLVTSWLHQFDLKTAWLSLDEGDNDPTRFISYFFAALLKSNIGINDSINTILESPHYPNIERKLGALINELFTQNSRDKVIFVLDDYQLIENQAVHQAVNFLLENQPPQLHLVIISREDPPLHLSLLRGRGELTDVRLADLRFSNQETADFLNHVMGLNLTPSQIEILENKTEGWVSGLQLAAISMQGNSDIDVLVDSFAGNNRYILDYLIEQVFQQQSEVTQNFLIQTSILDQMTAPLCDAVLSSDENSSPNTESQAMLEQLERANLFIIPLDESRQWFRYHQLFAGLLRHRLRLKKLDIDQLHRKAGGWLAENGFTGKAIEHYLLGADMEKSANLILQESSALIKQGEIATLIRWTNQLPEDVMKANPALCMSCVWALALSGREDEAEAYLTIVETDVESNPALHANLLTAKIHIARARHDHFHTIELSQQALSMVPDNQDDVRAVLNLNLGLAHWQTGQYIEAREALEEVIYIARKTNNLHAELLASGIVGTIQAVRGNLHGSFELLQNTVERGASYPASALAQMELGMLYYEWNRLEEANQLLQQSVILAERSGNVEVQGNAYRNLALLKQANGEKSEALAALEKAVRCVGESAPPLTKGRNTAAYVKVFLAQGNLGGAVRSARNMYPASASSFYPQLHLAPARISLAQGDKGSAAAYLEGQYAKAADADWGYGKIEIRLLQMLAAPTSAAALTFLGDALVMAQPQGFIRIFVDKGKEIIPFLHLAASQNITSEYVKELLAVLEADALPELSSKVSKDPGSNQLLEALSEREFSILRCLAEGKTNQEIASEMFVSLNTVKSHLKNIYGKLAVNSRREAVAQARVRNLLPDSD